jgi:hypothetical protein
VGSEAILWPCELQDKAVNNPLREVMVDSRLMFLGLLDTLSDIASKVPLLRSGSESTYSPRDRIFAPLHCHGISTWQATPTIACGGIRDRKQTPEQGIAKRRLLYIAGFGNKNSSRILLNEPRHRLSLTTTFLIISFHLPDGDIMAHRGETLHKDVCCIADLKRLGSSRLAPMVRGKFC